MQLNPYQLELISREYYTLGFVLGRDQLYNHLQQKYPPPNIGPNGPSAFDSRDAVGGWLKHQVVDQRFQYQRKPRVVSSMIPVRPYHSISIDLIDKQNTPSLVSDKGIVGKKYHYIFVIVDNFSRYMHAYALPDKKQATIISYFQHFYNSLFVTFPFLSQLTKPVEFVHSDNGAEFGEPFKQMLVNLDIGVSKTVPHTPQSNSIVERSNGILKRIFNKLIYIHGDEEYSKWADYLDQAVYIYNNKRNTTIGTTPEKASRYELKDEIERVVQNVKEKAIKPATFQNSYANGQTVRLRIPKGNISKFDKPNWSDRTYTITSVYKQTTDGLDNETPKPTRYKITPEHGTKESPVRYTRENLLAIPPILKPPKQTKPPAIPTGLVGYDMNVLTPNFLQGLFAAINGGT